MKLITRYLLRELLIPFLLGLILFTFVLLFSQMLDLMDLVVNKGVSLMNIGMVVLMGIPETFHLTIPMALVLATLMAYGRLAADNELTILRASGYPLTSLVIPVLLTALIISGVMLGMKQYGFPQIAQLRQHVLSQLKLTNPAGLIQPNTWITIGPFTIYAEDVDGSIMQGVELEDRREQPERKIFSRRGKWVEKENGRIELHLEDGQLHQVDEGVGRVLNFDQQVIVFRPQTVAEHKMTYEMKTITDLIDERAESKQKWDRWQTRIENRKEKKGSIPEKWKVRFKKIQHDYYGDRLNVHRAIAFPFATLALILVSAPLGMLAKRSGKSIGFGLSLLIIFLYYMGMSITEPMAIQGWLPFWLAMWIPNILFAGAGLALFARLKYRGS